METNLISQTNYNLDGTLFDYCNAVANDKDHDGAHANRVITAADANNAAHGHAGFNDGYIADADRAAVRYRNLNAEVARAAAKLAEAQAELDALRTADRTGMTPGERLGLAAAFLDDFSVIRFYTA
jgi:hypothetical protein